MAVQIRGQFLWLLFFLSSAFYVSFVAPLAQNICSSDRDCDPKEFCHWKPGLALNQGICEKCFDCALVHKKSYDGCARSERECRSCEVGFVEIDDHCYYSSTPAPLKAIDTDWKGRPIEDIQRYSTAALIIIPVLILATIISTVYIAKDPRQGLEGLVVRFRRYSSGSLVSIAGTDSSEPNAQSSSAGDNSPYPKKSTSWKDVQTHRICGKRDLSVRSIVTNSFQQATPPSLLDPLEYEEGENHDHPNPQQHLEDPENQEILALLDQALRQENSNQVVNQENHLNEASIPLTSGNVNPIPIQGGVVGGNPQPILQLRVSISNTNAQGTSSHDQVVPEQNNTAMTLEALANPEQNPDVIQQLSGIYDFTHSLPDVHEE
ncbi:unnamed protein product [Allacma fusca]|uniref:TNFR-Cys domain-containing protein n=1 Tax=Allacma fusca TaxID=39272 RepID=A0A8J2PW51_9HEXA|nr:unnamed protein product [Allacma fusca]